MSRWFPNTPSPRRPQHPHIGATYFNRDAFLRPPYRQKDRQSSDITKDRSFDSGERAEGHLLCHDRTTPQDCRKHDRPIGYGGGRLTHRHWDTVVPARRQAVFHHPVICWGRLPEWERAPIEIVLGRNRVRGGVQNNLVDLRRIQHFLFQERFSQCLQARHLFGQ